MVRSLVCLFLPLKVLLLLLLPLLPLLRLPSGSWDATGLVVVILVACDDDDDDDAEKGETYTYIQINEDI